MNPEPNIATLQVDTVTYFLPANEDEVMYLVNKAHQDGSVVCLRGAAHSRPLISKLEAEVKSGRIYILMSKMQAVTFNDELKQVTVQGGCHLGLDPSDPTNISTLANSLLYQLDQHRTDPTRPTVGWAVPDTGGITHQTVGGFLSTGSSGSNLNASFNEQLVSLTLITGGPNGAQRQTFTKDDPNFAGSDDNPFFAVGVGLGLFGIIVSATFQCIDSFNIIGRETTVSEQACPIDLFGNNPSLQSLPDFFRAFPYKRIMWWPQDGVSKVLIWHANSIPSGLGFVPKPYEEVTEITVFGIPTPIPAEFAADLMMRGFSDIPAFLEKYLGADSVLYKYLDEIGREKIVPALLNLFLTDGVQDFKDYWYSGIPMDNGISDQLIPVWFTELWFPIDKGPEVLHTLRTFFEANPDKVGTFSYEIYPAKASDFWLSPAYKTDVFRIDMFWFGYNEGSPDTSFYPAFWNLLEPMAFRPHWGKFLPQGNSDEGVSYLGKRYPNFQKWLALREELDPHQVFVSDYWRGHLGIPSLVQQTV
jgi:hypothetical protein